MSYVLFFFLTLFLVTYAEAETPPKTPSSKLPPVVVTANRLPTDILAELSSTTVITAEDIERYQYRTLADALLPILGATLVQSGGTGQLSSLFVRGTNSNHVLVLVDGIRVNDPSSPSGAYNFAPFQLEDMERIEIIRGPSSGLYGSDAIGGVITIMTPKGKGPLTAKAMIEGGTFDTCNEALSAQGGKDKANFNVSLSRLQTAGTRTIPNRLLTPTSDRRPDPYHNTSFTSRFGIDFNEKVSVSLFNRYFETKLGYHQMQKPMRQYSQDGYHRLQLDLSFLENKWRQTLGVSHVGINQQDKTLAEEVLSHSKGKRTKADWQHALQFAPWYTAMVSAEHEEEKFTSKMYHTKNGGEDQRNGLAVSNAFTFLDRLSLIASGRIDHVTRFAVARTYLFSGAYFNKPTKTKLKAGFGTGFKAPTLFQLFGNVGRFQANPALKPEQSRGGEIGLEQQLWNQRITVGTTYFRNFMTDLIAPNAQFTTNINIKRAVAEGLESFVECMACEALSIRLDHTYTRTRDLIIHKPLLRRPRHKVSLTLDSEIFDKCRASLTTVYVGQRADIDSQTFRRIRQGGYTLVNLALSYQVNVHWKFFGRIDNVLNRKYEDPNGYEHSGFGVFVGLKAVV